MSEDEREQRERWLTSAEVAELLDLPVSTVLCYSREIRGQLSVRQEGRRLLFSRDDIEAIREHRGRRRPKGLSAKEIAADLKIPYQRFLKILEPLKPLLPRVGPMVRPRGKGLYAPEAIEIIRREMKRSKIQAQRAGAAAEYWRGLAGIKLTAIKLSELSRDLSSTYAKLRNNPPSVTVFIHTLPDDDLELVHPLGVTVSPLRRGFWRAAFIEAGLYGKGRSVEEAVLVLRSEIALAYRSEDIPADVKRVLQSLVRRISSTQQ